MRINKYLVITILTIALQVQLILLNTSSNYSLAAENKYNNQLLKLTINQTDDNNVKVQLYTEKPYPITLSPIQKSNNEYIIFLPDTYHSITSKPDVSSCKDSVTDVDIKLIPYIGSNINNGYTKIVIKTTNSDVKLNIDNQISTQDIGLQQELSKVLQSKSIVLKPKYAVNKNVKPVNNASTSKPVTNPKKVSPQKSNEKLAKEVSANSQKTKTVSESKENTLNKTKNATETLIDNSEQVKDNNLTSVEQNNSGSPENIQENTTSAKNDSSTELIDNQVIPGSLSTTPDQKQLDKNKKGFSLTKLIIPILAFLVALIVLTNIFKKIRFNKNKITDNKLNQPKDPYAYDPSEDGHEEEHESPISHIKYNKPSQSMKARQSQDLISQLAQSPLKPVKNNPLKTRTSTEEFSSDEFYNIKSNKHSIIDNKPNSQPGEELKCIAGIEVADQKGFYLIQLENEKALVGIVDSEVFILNKFDKIRSPKFLVRKTIKESKDDKDVYFIQVGTWCGLVSSKQNNMKLETVF